MLTPVQHSPLANALCTALCRGDLSLAVALLTKGANINVCSEGGESLLVEVISSIDQPTRRALVVRFMLAHGADPLVIARIGVGPLFAAAMVQDVEVMRLLLDWGVDPNREDDGGESLYDWCEFDYRYECYGALPLPEEPSARDRENAETWLDFLERLATARRKPRPVFLRLLRERGACTTAELRSRPLGRSAIHFRAA